MTHDEKMAVIGKAAAARIQAVVRDLCITSGYARASMPMLAVIGLRMRMKELEAIERTLLAAARADQDGVPTESLICGVCGEHESRCQCADACDVCGKMDCDDLHETDAAGYEPRARA